MFVCVGERERLTKVKRGTEEMVCVYVFLSDQRFVVLQRLQKHTHTDEYKQSKYILLHFVYKEYIYIRTHIHRFIYLENSKSNFVLSL